MKYFEVVPDQEIANPIQIQRVDRNIYKNAISEEDFQTIPALAVGYFENLPERELYDVLHEPTFLLSDRVKRLLSLYAPKMEFKGIQLFAMEEQDNTAPLYWIPHIAPLECLGDETSKYPNGAVKQLVLDGGKVLKQNIFRVAGILEQKIIVSLPIAESMLRRKVSGISFVPVRFSGGCDEQK